MAKRGGSYISKIPLEWRTQTISVTDTTAVAPSTAEIDLDLQDDELAEIHCIDSAIVFGSPGEIDNNMVCGMLLSLDPDADDTPNTVSNLRDIEVFYWHRADRQLLLTTTGQVAVDGVSNKKWDCGKYPVMCGTNIGIVAEAESTVDTVVDFIVTVYFKRRKATAIELSQILLKRR